MEFSDCATPGQMARYEGVCCPRACGKCGGAKCFERPGGRAECCASEVVDRAYQHEGASSFEGHAPMPFDCSLPRFVHAAEKGSHTGWRATDRQKLAMVLEANRSFRRMNASNAAWCSCGDVANVVDWGRGGRGDIGSGSCSLRDGRLEVKTSSPPQWRDAATTR